MVSLSGTKRLDVLRSPDIPHQRDSFMIRYIRTGRIVMPCEVNLELMIVTRDSSLHTSKSTYFPGHLT